MPTTKDTAEAYHVGLVYGLVDPRRAIAWADRTIAASQHADPAVIAVSSAWAQGMGAIASALRQVPGRSDPSPVLRILLALVDDVMSPGPATTDDVARALDRIAFDEAIEGCDLQNELSGMGNAIDLARDGLYGNLDEARADVVRFVRTHRADVVD